MVDVLPTIGGDAGPREADPVVIVDGDGNFITSLGASAGSKDDANSTMALLGANEDFPGGWTKDNASHIGFSVKADQPGTLFVEFSIDDGATTVTSIPHSVWPGESRFNSFVKLPGRSHRVRYENGDAAQGSFQLLTATGDGLYPFAASDRDEPVFFAYSAQNVTAPQYAIAVDLSDRDNWPYFDVGRVDLYSSFLFVDRSSTAAGAVQLGVITRIDGTSADIAYVQGVSFTNSSDREVSRDRKFDVPLKLGQSGGNLTRAATAFKATNVTEVNTGITLPTSLGTSVAPAQGDLIIGIAHTAGTFTAAVSGQYRGHVSAT